MKIGPDLALILTSLQNWTEKIPEFHIKSSKLNFCYVQINSDTILVEGKTVQNTVKYKIRTGERTLLEITTF